MKMLAIDTSSKACSVALIVDQALYTEHIIAPQGQTRLILPMIQHLLDQANLKLIEIDALAFGCGPGSFTGVRIAASVAQGIAYATDMHLIRVSSLAALAQAAYQMHGWQKLSVAVDARMGEVYAAFYQVSSSGIVERVGAEQVAAPQHLLTPTSVSWHGVGDGWQIYSSLLQEKIMPLEVDSAVLPTAVAVAEIAKLEYQKKNWVSLNEALPVYLRDNVAAKPRLR